MNSMQRLELRQGQGQSLVMTPQLVQSIKLLQLSHLELSAYVEAELERNPLLQEGEAGAEAPAPPTLADFLDRKSTRLNSSHANISYAVFCLKKKKLHEDT